MTASRASLADAAGRAGRLTAGVRVFGHAAAVGFADARRIYTWRTWTTGWLLRVVAQVTFFALLGVLLGDPEVVRFLVIGNVVMLAAMSAMMATAVTTWERFAGTLPLLVAAPVSHVPALVGRSVSQAGDGVATALAAFAVVGPVLGVSLAWPQALAAVPMLVLVAVTVWCLGAFLGAVALRWPSARNVISNATYMTMMAICGVNVPVEFWPGWVQVVARALPLTHGLEAVRGVVGGGPITAALPLLAVEVGVAAAWLLLTALTLRRFVASGRRRGTIEFGT